MRRFFYRVKFIHDTTTTTSHISVTIPRKFFSKLNDGIFFSNIDLSDAYLQLKVDGKCRKFLVINTHVFILI